MHGGILEKILDSAPRGQFGQSSGTTAAWPSAYHKERPPMLIRTRPASAPRSGGIDDLTLHMEHPERTESVNHARRTGHPLSGEPGQPQQERTVRTGIPGRFAEQQDS